MIDEDDILSRYVKPDPDDKTGPVFIAERLKAMPEHQHLQENEISIEYLMRPGDIHRGNKRVLATTHEPSVQGRLKDLFEMLLVGYLGHMPDFLIVFDAEFWMQASDIEKEALVFHELSHIQQKLDKYGAPRFNLDGLPVYGLAEHDVTAFRSEVKRYGAWSEDLREFLKAATG